MGDKKHKKQEVSFSGTMSRDEALAYLEDFTKSVRSGAVRVERDGSLVLLNPGEVVKLEVKAKSKKDKQSFRLELSWNRRDLEIGD